MTSQSIFPTDDAKHGQMALESLGEFSYPSGYPVGFWI